MEESGATNLKYVPAMASFMVCPYSKTILLAPIHLFTKQIASTFIVSRINPKIVKIILTSFSDALYKVLSSIKNAHGFSLFL